MATPAHPSKQFDAHRLVRRLSALIAADTAAIALFTDQVMSLLREGGAAGEEDFKIELALREALANAVLHGCQSDPTKSVECTVASEEGDGVLIIVRDPGKGFDPLSVPNPLVGENILSDHGRGIFLMNMLMDEVRWERGGTEIHLRKR
ncbi:MAG TPA: ATP-binding protein [Candidatus Binatia bacterium]|nr:ATP-binding protein [Candidatus Binatia bacterium]